MKGNFCIDLDTYRFVLIASLNVTSYFHVISNSVLGCFRARTYVFVRLVKLYDITVKITPYITTQKKKKIY